MKVSELIEQLMQKMDEIGDVPVKILSSFEDEDGEDRNWERDIWYVSTLFDHFIYITPDD